MSRMDALMLFLGCVVAAVVITALGYFILALIGVVP